MTAFWDASAVVPLCVPGQEGTRGRQLLRQFRPVVWWGTPVEVLSAIIRLRRLGELSPSQHQVAWQRLEHLRLCWREVLPTERVRELAQRQLEIYELRAGDALQLAAALVWCNQRPRQRPFVCRDLRLSAAAGAAGFLPMEF